MSARFVIDDMRTGYLELVEWVQGGREVSPRGYKTWEIEDAVITLNNPRDALPVGVGRKPRVAIGAAEALLLCGGLASPSLLTSVSPAFRRFVDGGDLHGGYGRRIAMQLPRAVERLLQDPDSRQAVVTIWDPLYDMQEVRDLPCTLDFNFRVRNDRLNMSTTMRSNDVWLGACYDFFMFTQLQCTVANALGIEPGTYTHHAYSFHMYERNLEAADALHDYDPEEAADDDPYAVLRLAGEENGFGYGGLSIEECIGRARQVYDNEPPYLETDAEMWTRLTLQPYDRLTAAQNFSK